MTVKDAQLAKQGLEEQITIIVKLFEENTNAIVTNIHISRVVLQDMNVGHITSIVAEVHL